jgi:hypothetical protein
MGPSRLVMGLLYLLPYLLPQLLPNVSRTKMVGSVNSTINLIHLILMVMLFVGSFSQIKFENSVSHCMG